METGVEKIDRQHQSLIDLFNRLDEALNEKNNDEILRLVFQQMTGYTKFHFKTEEIELAYAGHPDAASHCELHRKFVMDLRHYEKKFFTGQRSAVEELLPMMRAWLMDHILTVDKECFTPLKPGSGYVPPRKDTPMSDWDWARNRIANV